MAKLRKLTVGIRPLTRMFRVRSIGSSIVDAVLALRGTKHFSDDYFVDVGTGQNQDAVRMFNDVSGNSLQVDLDNVVFTKDAYESNRSIDFSEFHTEFRLLWDALNEVLTMRNVRRIGLVGEYRFRPNAGTPSKALLEKLTTIKPTGFADKFMLRYEDRSLHSDGRATDRKQDDFLNYIYQFYESSSDDSHKNDNELNANLDVQRYYAPVISGHVPDELMKLKKDWDRAATKMVNQMVDLGFLDAKA